MRISSGKINLNLQNCRQAFHRELHRTILRLHRTRCEEVVFRPIALHLTGIIDYYIFGVFLIISLLIREEGCILCIRAKSPLTTIEYRDILLSILSMDRE